MKDKAEKLDSVIRGIIYAFIVVFALVASFVPGALVWTAVAGATLLIGGICTVHDALHPVKLRCSMCLFHQLMNGLARCKLKETIVRDGPVCSDFVWRGHLKAA